MNRNAYLFAASVVRTQLKPTRLSRGGMVKLVQTWGECPSVMVCANARRTPKSPLKNG